MKKHHDMNRDIARMGYVLPVFVLFLVLGPYFFVIPYVIIPRLEYSFAGVANMAVATALVSLVLIHYFMSCMTPPGSPPSGWKPDVEIADEAGASKFCQKCAAFKPPRAHHCRVCNKCILKMDHHCPWINNCVGHNNHKYFILFLVYAVTGITYCIGLLFKCFIDVVQHSMGPDDFLIIMGFTITATILLPVGLAILMLLCWQLWLVSKNTTSIEYEDSERQKYTCKKEGKAFKYVNVYNVGTMGNFRSVMGNGVLWWLLPTRPEGDGLSYKKDYRSSR